jgi:hypothetical protein
VSSGNVLLLKKKISWGKRPNRRKYRSRSFSVRHLRRDANSFECCFAIEMPTAKKSSKKAKSEIVIIVSNWFESLSQLIGSRI